MSQSSLLTQLKLQRKLQKSQSQLQTFDSLDDLGEEKEEEDEISNDEEVASRELQENIARLVYLHFFYLHFKQTRGESRERYDFRRLCIVRKLFPEGIRKETLPLFPVHSLVSAYPLGLVCKCGTLFSRETFGVIPECMACFGLGKKAFRWPSNLKGTITGNLFLISNAWHDWAESVAIQLETKRKSNRNRVTDFEEKET